MDMVGESPRGLHAIRVLENKKDFTLDRLRDAAYDSYLTAFDRLVPALLAAYDSTPANDSLKRALAGPSRRSGMGLSLGVQQRAHVACRVLGRHADGPHPGRSG